MIWLFCQMSLYFLLFPLNGSRRTNNNTRKERKKRGPPVHLDTDELRQQRKREAEKALGTAANSWNENEPRSKILIYKDTKNSRKAKFTITRIKSRWTDASRFHGKSLISHRVMYCMRLICRKIFL